MEWPRFAGYIDVRPWFSRSAASIWSFFLEIWYLFHDLEFLQNSSYKVLNNVLLPGKLAVDHRDLHSTVSKVGKSIDRNFGHDFDSTYKEEFFRLVFIGKAISSAARLVYL